MMLDVLFSKIMRRIVKVLALSIGGLALLSIIVSLLLLIPSVQTFVADKATEFLSKKTGTTVSVRSVHIAFPKTVRISGIFTADSHGDTLLYCRKLDVNASLFALIGKKVNISYLGIEGLKGNVVRNTGDTIFNYSSILESFASKNKPENSTEDKTDWDLGFEEIELKNIALNYADHLDSTFISLDLGELSVDAEYTDILSSKYDLDEISISQTSLSLSFPENKGDQQTEKTSQKPIPLDLDLDVLNASNIRFKLTIGEEEFALNTFVKTAKIEPDKIDLTNSRIEINSITTDGIEVSLSMMPSDTSQQNPGSENSPISQISEYTFGNFDWSFLVKHADINRTSYRMDLNDEPRLASGMDYLHMDFKDFHVSADSLFFDKDQTNAVVRSLSVSEISGGTVENLSGKFFMDNQNILADKFDLKTSKSQINGTISLSYPTMRSMGQQLNKLGLNSDLTGYLQLDEAKLFTSFIDSIAVLQKLRTIKVNRLITEGDLGNLTVSQIDCSLTDSTMINLRGHIYGLPGSNLSIDYSLDTFRTCQGDLLKFAPDSLIPSNIRLPQVIGLSSKGNTNLKDGELSAILASDYGLVNVDFKLKDHLFDGQLNVHQLDLGAVLSDTTLGELSLTSKIEGQMEEFNPTKFDWETDILKAEWNHLTFENARLEASLEDDVYNYRIEIADTSVSVSVTGDYFQKDSINHLTASFDISTLDLQGLNLMDEYFMTSAKVNVEMHAKSARELTGEIKCNDVRLYRPGDAYYIKSLELRADMSDASNDFFLRSDIVDASLTGNTGLQELNEALLDHVDLFIHLPDSIVSEKDFVFDFDLTMKKPDFFTRFLIDGLQEFQLDKCQAHYDDKRNILTAEIVIPKIHYQDIELKDLSLVFDTMADSAFVDFQLSELQLNPVSIAKIGVRSVFTKDQAGISFYARDKTDSLKYQLAYDINFQDSVYKISIPPGHTVINYENWELPEDNMLLIGKNLLNTTSAQLSNGEQKISLKASDQNLSLSFEKFNLSNITEVLAQDTSNIQAAGIIDGTIDFLSVFSDPKILSDLAITDVSIEESLLGDLHAKVEYQKEMPLKFDVELQNEQNMFHTSGVATSGPQQTITANLELDITNASTFQPLISEYVSRLGGAVKGKLAVKGNVGNPSFNGNINFQSLDITTLPTGTRLNTNGQIAISDNLVIFNNFSVKDSLQNNLDITGEVDLRRYNDPLFNVRISANDFLAVNSPKAGKEVVEGKLHLGLDLNITGRKSKLKVVNSVKINEGTDIVYSLPGNELELITDEGIVEYVDFDQPEPDTLLMGEKQFFGDSIVSMIEGIDFTTLLDINPKARFTVIVDPNSGDYTEFNLNGKLQYSYNDNLKGHLSGLLEFQKGFYELSFYGLVKKRFEYQPGSVVSWSGDVMEGDLNFAAKYTVRTNSVGLVSNEISSYERTMYNQRLPYDVLLKVENKISNPVISFGIDLPERYRSTYPTLDSKLNFLNQTNWEAERNKQVFALLVGGAFIPEDPSMAEGSGGSNFATTAARNSVNAIMTQQLNNFTGQFIQGLDVDMGVNTFDDYESGKAETRTQLDVKVSKNLFNDRVTAEMESHINLDGSVKEAGNQSTAGLTEFAVSYKLTESGNYRIKAFRENAYDIFDGEIQNSGLAFIFIKEFDSFGKGKKESPDNSEKKEIINEEEER
jgi:hypothetical protein